MIEKLCERCKKPYNTYPSQARKYCSKSCLAKSVWTGRKHTEETKTRMRKQGLDIDEIISSYKNDKTLQEIAEIYLCSKGAIKNLLKRNGIALRGSGTRKGKKSLRKGKPQLSTRGVNNPNWKGGVTTLNQQVRHCVEYKLWRSTIFERDNWTCQKCQKRGGWLEVDHHPKKFSDIMSEYGIDTYEKAQICQELWDTKNGRVLCKKCHK